MLVLVRLLRIVVWCVVGVVALATLASLHPTVRSVYRALRPSTSYDTSPPQIPDLSDPAVLVFSKTNGFRHADAIPAGVEALQASASQRGWSLFHTENGAVFDSGLLSRFRAVVWLNASGAPVNATQRDALRGWLESGGGFVGVHAALDDSHASWEWYVRTVIGARFIGHALGLLPATIHVEQPDHVACRNLDSNWNRVDEWYSFDRSVRGDPGVEVLASLDESTYEPRLKLLWLDQDLAMGDHPIIWTRHVGNGRAFLTALGHSAESYAEPEYRAVLEGALEWVINSDDDPASE